MTLAVFYHLYHSNSPKFTSDLRSIILYWGCNHYEMRYFKWPWNEEYRSGRVIWGMYSIVRYIATIKYSEVCYFEVLFTTIITTLWGHFTTLWGYFSILVVVFMRSFITIMRSFLLILVILRSFSPIFEVISLKIEVIFWSVMKRGKSQWEGHYL